MKNFGGSEDGLLTVRELLQIPSVLESRPVILVGGAALDNTVRWVHVSGIRQAISFMRGGEVLLTNCGGWPTAVSSLLEVAAELTERGAAGVIIELNARFPSVHPAFTEALETAGIALVQLEGPVDSVSVTEHAHRRILIGQSTALEARDEVHQLLIALTLRGASAEFLVNQLGRILKTAVVLENSAGEIVALGGADWATEELRWFRLATADMSSRAEPDGVIRVTVEARGKRWGTLTALPGPAHPAGRRVVLEQGAIALAFERLTSNDEHHWLREATQLLFVDLLEGRFTSSLAVKQRLGGLGFTLSSRRLYGAVLQGSMVPSDEELRLAASKLHWEVLSTRRSEERADLLLSLPHASILDERSARKLVSGGDRVEATTRFRLVIGPAAFNAQQLVDSLTMADSFAGSDPVTRLDSDVMLLQLERRPLLSMLSAIRRDPSSLKISVEILQPIVDYDREYGTDLMSTLAAVVRNPLSRSKAIAESGLSRTVFYKRLRVLEDLLNRGDYMLNLDDDEAVMALQLAIRILSRSAPQ